MNKQLSKNDRAILKQMDRDTVRFTLKIVAVAAIYHFGMKAIAKTNHNTYE
jgi:hypothetical protein